MDTSIFRAFMGTSKLFATPGHFYSPIADRQEARQHIQKLKETDGPILGVTLDDDLMKKNWHRFTKSLENIPFPEEKQEGFRYYYNNDQFSYGDAYVYFAHLKTLQPNHIIEIGSGYSSALALDACDILEQKTHFTFIEPYPDRLNLLLNENDHSRCTLIEDKVQNVDLAIFEKLQENDILFIDSSHVAKTGSDVCFEIFEIIPRLNSGVHVIIHDMFYPFEYPEPWAVEENRSWNELYLIRAFLMYNPHVSIEFFNHYFGLKFPELADQHPKIFSKNYGGSLWLKIR